MVEFKLDDCVIAVERGDITQVQADAIVNPANSRMIMGGGVAGAIKRIGGSLIEREAVQKSPVAIGDAIATTAGKLKAKYVIHAPTMERPAMSTDLANAEKATTAALRVARNLGLSSIAVPGMGTGVGGLPVQEAARVMIEAVRRHLSEGTTLKRIEIISIDEALTAAFVSALQ